MRGVSKVLFFAPDPQILPLVIMRTHTQNMRATQLTRTQGLAPSAALWARESSRAAGSRLLSRARSSNVAAGVSLWVAPACCEEQAPVLPMTVLHLHVQTHARARTHAQEEEQPRRVVVTGMGVVSPIGHELDEFYNNLLAGKSGISMIEVSHLLAIATCLLQ